MEQIDFLSPEALAEVAKTAMPALREAVVPAIAGFTGIPEPVVNIGIAGLEGFARFILGQAVEGVNAQGEIVLRLDQLQKGVAALGSDFHVLAGDIVWLAELQNASLKSILETLQAPLDTQEKELRKRAEYAYRVGWYDHAIKDLKKAQEVNYPDFTLYRTLGNIYYYHRVDLEQALEQYRKAAYYAKPQDKQQAAEAHLFAAYVCSDLLRINEAISECQKALEHDANLAVAHYHLAVCEAKVGSDAALRSLETTIRKDAGFYERALTEPCFYRDLYSEVAVINLLMRLREEAISNAETLKLQMKSSDLLRDYVPDQKMQTAFDACCLRLSRNSAYSDLVAACAEVPVLLSRVRKGKFVLSTVLPEHEVSTPQDYILVGNSFVGVLARYDNGIHITFSVEIWDIHTGGWIKTLWQGTAEDAYGFAASPEGKHIKFHTYTNKNFFAYHGLYVFDVLTGERQVYHKFDDTVSCSSAYQDENNIVVYHHCSEPQNGRFVDDQNLIFISIGKDEPAVARPLEYFGGNSKFLSDYGRYCHGSHKIQAKYITCIGSRIDFLEETPYASNRCYFFSICLRERRHINLLDPLLASSTENGYSNGATALSEDVYAHTVFKHGGYWNKSNDEQRVYINSIGVSIMTNSDRILAQEDTPIDLHASDRGDTLIVDLIHVSKIDALSHSKFPKFVVCDVAMRSVIQHLPYRFVSASRYTNTLIVRTEKDEIAVMRRTLTLAE